MNFITKNLGWILLLLFFIFMLFIISSNDPQRVNLTGTGNISTGTTLSGETDKNLDDLIKLIDSEKIDEGQDDEETQELNEQKEVTESEDDQAELSSSGTITSQEEDKERGFFAKLFGRDEEEELEEEATMSGSGSNENLEEENKESITDDTVVSTDTSASKNNQVSQSANIIKSTSGTQKKVYKDYSAKNTAITYPGTNLVTAVGNTYEIGVGMLKLNNISFTRTIELMNQGDVVEQLSLENKYGCFQVRVLSTGSVGYVCKKYLAERSDSQEKVESSIPQKGNAITSEIETTTIPKITTQIGSYYKIAIQTPSFFDVILERFVLSKGDILRQVSNADSNTGCVEMKVVGTNSGEHDGKIVSICSPDMVSPIK